ncbi:MAG: NAD-binding protein [Negativibacillus sp.]
MRIIIVGCGKVGTTLIEQLSREGHDITIIDRSAKLVQTLTDRAKVYVNGERIEGEHRLQNNDTLRIGKTTIRLVL